MVEEKKVGQTTPIISEEEQREELEKQLFVDDLTGEMWWTLGTSRGAIKVVKGEEDKIPDWVLRENELARMMKKLAKREDSK